MGKSALIVVDTQVNMFDESFSVYAGERILKTIGGLIKKARESTVEVIFVRNNGAAGEPDEPGTDGWQLHPMVYPEVADLVIDKESPDAFAGTELQTELDNRGINRIILVGMQTEMCVAVTAQQAAKRGFEVTLVEDGHTTFDWDDIAAVDAIAQHNRDLAQLADVRKAQDVEFG